MSQLVRYRGGTSTGAAGLAASARLWPALARPIDRPPALEGLDRSAARVRGLAVRRRAGKALRARAEHVQSLASALQPLSESGLDEQISTAREQAQRARHLADTVDRGMAIACEVVRRELGLVLHTEQVMGALVLASGQLAEMATGEGKTVTAILPAAIDGWAGRGVHVCTVNDYLAKRDAEWCSPAYRRLGLSVGVVSDRSTPSQRRRAYDADITYAADKQLLFDYLRDRLRSPARPRMAGVLAGQVTADGLEAMGLSTLSDALPAPGRLRPGSDAPMWGEAEGWHRRVVQRGLCCAIVDEADSVLIDEAITPAIISEPIASEPQADDGAMPATPSHHAIARDLSRGMSLGAHVRVDERRRRVSLTEAGRALLAEHARSLPAFWAGPNRREELVVLALQAEHLMRRGEDYIVRGGDVVIVDRSTGRVLEGRQWQLGVHQAVQAKEGLDISNVTRTSARISYQRFFQQYQRLSGMSGTLWEVAGEMWEQYGLGVVRIPTHRPIARRQGPTRVLLHKDAKERRVAERVRELWREGRPVLVGTRSVDASERLGALLAESGMSCRVLNAVREGEEAQIVAEAGQPGAVTVATNMAGRGTDIVLTPRSRALGGLVVIATERQEERRVDRQLFGRSGRQGDPGLAEVFVALDDLVLVRHSPRWLTALAKRLAGHGARSGGELRGMARTIALTAAWLGQRSASAKSAAVRTEQAKAESWIEMAIHTATR